MDLRNLFDCMISVSQLGRGQASKVIQTVEDEGSPYIVVKNNKPQAVIISIREYSDLMKARDAINAMKTMSQQDSYSPNTHHPQHRSGSLTADEINIFLNEDND